MAELSQNELKAITAHPVRKGLETFRTTFASRYLRSKNADVTEVVDRLTSGVSDRGEKDVILDFVLALQAQPAARTIRSRIGNGPLSGDIASFYARLSAGQEKAKHVAPLLKLVVTLKSGIAPQNNDADIWTAVFDLIARTRPLQLPQPTTPPPSHPSFTSSFQQTPWSFNTGSFADASEHRKQVGDVLREELLPTLRIDVPDFIPAVFGPYPRLDKLAETVFDRCQEEDTPLYTKGSGWNGWPPSADEDLVLEWLQDLTTRFMAWTNDVHAAASRQIYKGPSTYLDGSPIKRKMDVGIMGRHGNKDDEVDKKTRPKSNWAQILVIGELKSNSIEDGQEPAWLDLATYAREVSRTQDRRFVLGFTLCGSRMRLWHFDRSGSSGSSSFDINRDGFKFVHVMLGYHLMDDKQLGLDPTIQQSDGQRYVEITRDNQIERLILTKEIKKQAVIVGRATTCWRAYCDKDQSKEPLLVKDSWQYVERPEEGELIKEATDKGVRNVARYYHHETVQVDGKNDDTIENVRRGLMKTCSRTRFKQRSFNEPDASVSEPPGKSVAGRSQSQSQSHSLSRKRSSSAAQIAPPASLKRSCSSFESRNSGSPVHNRVHRRVITRDPGKPIYNASSPVALITGLIGAIKGHESSLNAGILHRDISIGNIMLTENEDDGFLIDYDLAIQTSSDRASGAPGKTGTKVFMAIGALLGEHHSPMHDLESFFWVKLWICFHWNGPGQERRKVKEFEDWNTKPIKELAKLKMGLVSKRIFDTVEDSFTPYCKRLFPCLRELHEVIFPGGTPWSKEDRPLYSRVVAVLEKYEFQIRPLNLPFETLTTLLESNQEDRLQCLVDMDIPTTGYKEPREAVSMAGTKVFMAIGALLGEPHSFMHDLESFFWVLFWICIHYDGLDDQGKVKRRSVRKYEKWNYADVEELADLKKGLIVEEDGFDKTIAGFAPGCKSLIPCVQELRKCIFPNGKRWLGENKELYSQMKAVLDKASRSM